MPANNLQELLAYLRANEKTAQFASAGVGSGTHLPCVLFNLATGLNITHVPYRGASPAITDLLGGQVDLIVATAGSVHKYVQAGRMRALAVTSNARTDAYRGVPTVAETIPGYVAEVWYAILAPAGTPAPVLQRLNAAMKKAAQRLRQRYRDLLRERIAATVDEPSDVEDEIRTLFTALSAR